MKKSIFQKGILFSLLILLWCNSNANFNDLQFLRSFGFNDDPSNRLILIRHDNEDLFSVQYYLYENSKKHQNSDLFLINEIFTGDTVTYLFELLYKTSQIDSIIFINNPELKKYYFSSIYESINKMNFFRSTEISISTKTRIFMQFISLVKSINKDESGEGQWCSSNFPSYFQHITNAKFIYNKSSLVEFEEMLIPQKTFFIVPSFWKKLYKTKTSEILYDFYFSSYPYYMPNDQIFRKKLLEKNKVFLKSILPELRADLANRNCFFIYTLPDLRVYKVLVEIVFSENVFHIDLDEVYLNSLYNLNFGKYDFWNNLLRNGFYNNPDDEIFVFFNEVMHDEYNKLKEDR